MNHASSFFSIRSTLLAGACSLVMASTAVAQAKKPVTIIVGFGSGGAYYMTALLVSQYMPKYLPDNPKIIIKNMPGAGSIVATNYLANIAPRDGSVLGVIGAGIITEAMFGNTKAKYDPRKLGWLGSMSSGVNLCTVWSESGIKTIADATKKEVSAGSTGRGSRTYTYPLAMNLLLGTKFKIVSGYKGLNHLQPALEKREVDSVCGYAWEGLKAQKLAWVKDGKLNIIAQFARKKSAEFPNVPLMRDLVKTETQKQALDLMVIDTLIAWPVVTPPGLPPETLKMYRDAFAKTMKDPAFIAAAGKVKRDVDLVSGEEVDKVIAEAYAYPAAAIDEAKRLSGLK
ncbi:MAG: tripartite tricarboxylate transporter substrate-binding protein [Beijerinckiaceae bacterium]|jgi:tripartite-type tricarboxylate transporter receptor subunit TctC|nr:tripartite tricarboxylate transporter substrate-binding protein [Beijerinckiaceae bacterium]